MVEWVADQVSRLIAEEGAAPEQIVLLAPFLSDVLRFGLVEARINGASRQDPIGRRGPFAMNRPRAPCWPWRGLRTRSGAWRRPEWTLLSP